ncbi:MAG: hypothetical protein ABI306_02690 [Caulobacteraceae bacterium]
MKFHTLASLATAASLLAVGFAAAQPAGPPKVKEACAADIQKMCATAGPGRATMQCMRGHMADASPGCQSAMQTARAMHAQRKAAAAAAATQQPAPNAPAPQ